MDTAPPLRIAYHGAGEPVTFGKTRSHGAPGQYHVIYQYEQEDVGLEAITKPGIPVTVYSDSKYVVDAVEKRWVFGWQKKASPAKPTVTCGLGF